MYSILHELLKDKKGGEIFKLFGPWHFFYIMLTVAIIATVLIIVKSKIAREIISRVFISIAF